MRKAPVPDDPYKRALLVGIDEYQHLQRLSGCVNDVTALTPLLGAHANTNPNFTCVPHVSSQHTVTRDVLLDALDTLLAPGADVALLYFAGHGLQATNDVVLATQETRSPNDGVALSAVLEKVQNSNIPSVTIILDCCFSGGAGGVPQLGTSVAVLRKGLAILTASRADQPAAETVEGRGLFSSLLCGALDGGAADVLGKVTIAGVYAYLAESFGSWDQKPTFKANLEALHTLRDCIPALDRAELRSIVQLFPAAGHCYPLDRTYEPTDPSHVPEHGSIMKLLQRGRAARIIEPVGTDHLYYAALEKKPCRLTPLGRHYWVRNKQSRL